MEVHTPSCTAREVRIINSVTPDPDMRLHRRKMAFEAILPAANARVGDVLACQTNLSHALVLIPFNLHVHR